MLSEQESHLTTASELTNSRLLTKLVSCDETDKIVPKMQDNRLLTMSRKYQPRIVGEEKLVQLLICAVISRNLPPENRSSVLILNNYASGKSHLINTVLEPIKDTGDVLDFTYFTEAHLKRSEKFANVNGKVIKIEQLERKDDNGQIFISSLKHLITEGQLNFGVVDKDEKGKQVARELSATGFPVIITTSTNPNINPEDESRFIVIELDESDEQTAAIMKHKALNNSKIKSNDIWVKSKNDLADDFAELKRVARHIQQIIIPFEPKIAQKLPNNRQMRRDYDKLVRLTRIIAFINYKNRTHLISNEPEHLPVDSFGKTEEFYKSILLASVDDFKKALEIAGKSISQTINNTTEKSMIILEIIKRLATSYLDGVTLNDLEKSSKLAKNTLRDHLRILEESGFLTRDNTTKEHRWTPTEKKHLDIEIDIEFTDDDLKSWIEEANVGGSYSVVTSYDEQKKTDFVPESVQNKSRNQFREES